MLEREREEQRQREHEQRLKAMEEEREEKRRREEELREKQREREREIEREREQAREREREKERERELERQREREKEMEKEREREALRLERERQRKLELEKEKEEREKEAKEKERQRELEKERERERIENERRKARELEKEAREKELREKEAREKEQREKEAREKEQRETEAAVGDSVRVATSAVESRDPEKSNPEESRVSKIKSLYIRPPPPQARAPSSPREGTKLSTVADRTPRSGTSLWSGDSNSGVRNGDAVESVGSVSALASIFGKVARPRGAPVGGSRGLNASKRSEDLTSTLDTGPVDHHYESLTKESEIPSKSPITETPVPVTVTVPVPVAVPAPHSQKIEKTSPRDSLSLPKECIPKASSSSSSTTSGTETDPAPDPDPDPDSEPKLHLQQEEESSLSQQMHSDRSLPAEPLELSMEPTVATKVPHHQITTFSNPDPEVIVSVDDDIDFADPEDPMAPNGMPRMNVNVNVPVLTPDMPDITEITERTERSEVSERREVSEMLLATAPMNDCEQEQELSPLPSPSSLSLSLPSPFKDPSFSFTSSSSSSSSSGSEVESRTKPLSKPSFVPSLDLPDPDFGDDEEEDSAPPPQKEQVVLSDPNTGVDYAFNLAQLEEIGKKLKSMEETIDFETEEEEEEEEAGPSKQTRHRRKKEDHLSGKNSKYSDPAPSLQKLQNLASREFNSEVDLDIDKNEEGGEAESPAGAKRENRIHERRRKDSRKGKTKRLAYSGGDTATEEEEPRRTKPKPEEKEADELRKSRKPKTPRKGREGLRKETEEVGDSSEDRSIGVSGGLSEETSEGGGGNKSGKCPPSPDRSSQEMDVSTSPRGSGSFQSESPTASRISLRSRSKSRNRDRGVVKASSNVQPVESPSGSPLPSLVHTQTSSSPSPASPSPSEAQVDTQAVSQSQRHSPHSPPSDCTESPKLLTRSASTSRARINPLVSPNFPTTSPTPAAATTTPRALDDEEAKKKKKFQRAPGFKLLPRIATKGKKDEEDSIPDYKMEEIDTDFSQSVLSLSRTIEDPFTSDIPVSLFSVLNLDPDGKPNSGPRGSILGAARSVRSDFGRSESTGNSGTGLGLSASASTPRVVGGRGFFTPRTFTGANGEEEREENRGREGNKESRPSFSNSARPALWATASSASTRGGAQPTTHSGVAGPGVAGPGVAGALATGSLAVETRSSTNPTGEVGTQGSSTTDGSRLDSLRAAVEGIGDLDSLLPANKPSELKRRKSRSKSRGRTLRKVEKSTNLAQNLQPAPKANSLPSQISESQKSQTLESPKSQTEHSHRNSEQKAQQSAQKAQKSINSEPQGLEIEEFTFTKRTNESADTRKVPIESESPEIEQLPESTPTQSPDPGQAPANDNTVHSPKEEASTPKIDRLNLQLKLLQEQQRLFEEQETENKITTITTVLPSPSSSPSPSLPRSKTNPAQASLNLPNRALSSPRKGLVKALSASPRTPPNIQQPPEELVKPTEKDLTLFEDVFEAYRRGKIIFDLEADFGDEFLTPPSGSSEEDEFPEEELDMTDLPMKYTGLSLLEEDPCFESEEEF